MTTDMLRNIAVFDDSTPKPIDYMPASHPAPRPISDRMKRFTLEIPDQLHRRIKAGCAMEGIVMSDLIRAMLDSRFPAKP